MTRVWDPLVRLLHWALLGAIVTGFGLGSLTGTEFLGESKGFVDDAETIDGHRAYVQMFGQGVTATSADAATVVAADGRIFGTADGGATWTTGRS